MQSRYGRVKLPLNDFLEPSEQVFDDCRALEYIHCYLGKATPIEYQNRYSHAQKLGICKCGQTKNTINSFIKSQKSTW